MDIISLFKAERDKIAQQLKGRDTAIQALSGLSANRVSLSGRSGKYQASSTGTMGEGQGGQEVRFASPLLFNPSEL